MKLIDSEIMQALKHGINGLETLIKDDIKNAELEMNKHIAGDLISQEYLKSQAPLMTKTLVILIGSILLELVDNMTKNMNKDDHD